MIFSSPLHPLSEAAVPLDGNRSTIPTAKKAIRFWRDYLEAIGVKDGGDGLGSHFFRHGFADQLRLADYLDTELSVALGHNLKTVTSGYGVIPQGTVKRLSQMIENVTFEGVKVDHLFR